MRKKKTPLLKAAGAVVALGALALINQCIEKIEKRGQSKPMDEAKLQRRLTAWSVIYHALGIFYNE